MREIHSALLPLAKLKRRDAFDTFVSEFQARTIVGSHTSYVAILDNIALVFSPTDDWNKVALSKLGNNFPHAPNIKLQMMAPDFNVFKAPVYKFLTDETHSDYRRLQTLANKLQPDEFFDAKRVHTLMNRSRNSFVFNCARILKCILTELPSYPKHEFYFDLQPSNIAVGQKGELLAYDLFDIERRGK